MKIAILGYGSEGKSSLSYFSKDKTNVITVCDSNTNLELPKGVLSNLGENYLDSLDQFDVIVRSPGIKLSDIKTKTLVTSQVKIFFDKCPAPIIAVTGTKGKSTTTSLIYHILTFSKHRVWLGGNIGKPVLDFLDKVKKDDLVVLELSSFQLQDLTKSPHIGVATMIEPEHLDYHKDFDKYFLSKSNLFKYQKTDDIAVYNINNQGSKKLADFSKAKKIAYGINNKNTDGARLAEDKLYFNFQYIADKSQVKLKGDHNLENVLAAIAATHEYVNDANVLSRAIGSFESLPHRLEFIGKINGVSYYDDSIATTPSATIAAIRSFDKPKILILGGSDKGVKFDELAREIMRSNVRKVIAIGKMADQISSDLKKVGYTDIILGAKDMQEIVGLAKESAREYDVVLLSPACASFDMFANYVDRGDQFKKEVLALR